MAVQQGQYEWAARLLAATQTLLDRLPPYLKATDRGELAQLITATQTVLGAENFAAA